MTDKDPAIDRLMKRAAQVEAATPAGACPDAEQLAAFASGTLRAAERDACEAHVAGCARCLQLVATLARTEDAVPAAVPWWRPANWTWWLVPATAVATAVALWVNVAPNQDRVQKDQDLASADERAAPARPAVPMPTARPETDAVVEKAPDPAKSRQAAKPADRAVAPEVRARDQKSDRKDLAARRQESQAKAAEAAGTPAAPVAAPPPATVVPTQPKELENRAAAARELENRAAAAQDRLAALYRASAGAIEVASPDPAVRWRFSGLTIERTADGGATWAPQFTAVATLVAGSSPSSLVAWAVGRGGTVLLTTDGQRWQRAPFPEATDLVAIRARNEREADVTTHDGRVFRTSDGGKTWQVSR